VERALRNFVATSSLRAKYSEIILSADVAQRSTALARARRLAQEIAKGADFGDVARKNSVAPNAARGGVRDWTKLSDLPTDIAKHLRKLQPGQVSQPLVIDGGVALYQMGEMIEDPLNTPIPNQIDFAKLLVPNDTSAPQEIAKIKGRVDTCDDLYTVAKSLPAERLLRETVAQTALSPTIAAQLTLMDPGEVDTTLIEGPWRVMLMLCSRGPGATHSPSPEEVRMQLTSQRLGGQAEIFLEELRSEAIIRVP
jgi:peptidyl-prolyl cis-trans isomerase SurA